MGAVEVRGLRELREGLAWADSNAEAALKNLHRDLANRERDSSRRNARSGTRLTERAAMGIGSSSSHNQARITVRPTAAAPMARVAFWGALARTGWYARARYDGSTRQHPVWVGQHWRVAVRGEGPYVINYTLAEDMPEIEHLYFERLGDLYERAFPAGQPLERSTRVDVSTGGATIR